MSVFHPSSFTSLYYAPTTWKQSSTNSILQAWRVHSHAAWACRMQHGNELQTTTDEAIGTRLPFVDSFEGSDKTTVFKLQVRKDGLSMSSVKRGINYNYKHKNHSSFICRRGERQHLRKFCLRIRVNTE